MNTKIIVNKNKNLLINFSLNGGIDIYVDSGNFNEPYYQFYLDSNGETIMDNLDVSIGKTYTFYRLNAATSHPFYISDLGYNQVSSDKITLSGDGDKTTGITNSESFTVTFNENIENLYYFCTAHSNMIENFELTNNDDNDEGYDNDVDSDYGYDDDNIGDINIDSEVLELNVGWNLIGSSRNCQILDEADIVEENTLYEFNESYPNTYTNVTTLKSNEGYYVFAKSAGAIKLVPV